MADSKLEEQISVLYDMELNNYMMNRAIEQLNQKISWMGRPRKIGKPTRANRADSVFDTILGHLLMLGAIGGGIGAVIGIIYALIAYDKSFFMMILYALGEAIAFAFYGVILGVVIGIIVGIVSVAKEGEKIEKSYQRSCQQHKVDLRNEQLRLEQEKQQKTILTRQLSTLHTHLVHSDDLLDEFYAAAGIDPQFRNLICIGYMQEYIRLGISTHLDGVDGLYYLIMQALRMDQIQYTLDEISAKLDTIIDHQRDVYNDLLSLNAKCDRMPSQPMLP